MILRRILAGILSVVMIMCFLPLQQFTPILQEIIASASAAEVVASGECGADGDNLTWTLDDEGMLTISGQGEMADGSNGEVLPWFEYDYKSINSITILDGVTSIGDRAFQDCTSLTSIIIPNSVKSIGMFALRNTEWLVQKQNENPLVVVNGILIDGTTSNGSVIVPEGVISIGQYAFSGCDGLTDIIIPNGVTSIESDAFSHCNNLANAIISDGVVSIGYYAFSYCERLITIEIPGSVKNIGVRAFSDTPWMAQQQAETPLVVVNGILIDGTTSTGSVIIPDNVTSIGWNAFSNCESLTSITIPNSVTSIEWGAFSNCDNLTSITIPNSVTNIEGSAFSSCDNLTTVIIPNSVTNIDDYVFHGTPWLTQQQAKSPLVVVNGILIDGTTSNGSVTIPDDVMSVGSYAFGFCDNLSTITISNSVTSIKRGAFNGCDNLTTITIPDSVISVDNSAFSSCNNLTDVYYTGTEEEWNAITINSGNECLTSAKVHFNHVEDVPSIAFGTINGLKWTLTNEGVLTISGSGLMGLDDANTAPWMKYADKITEVVIEDGVMDIGKAAFSGCTNLTSVTIPDSVYSIKQGAFKDCKSLTSVIIPNGISEIQAEVFSGCVALLGIHIPRSVIAVEENAFYGCGALTNIYYGGIPTDRSAVSIDAAASNVIDLMNLEWHYLDEYYYSDVDPKIYEQMHTLCDKPTYYGNSETADIIKCYREMAKADPEVKDYQFWKNVSKALSVDLTNFEGDYNVKLTTEALIAEIFLNPEINTSLNAAAEQSIEEAQNQLLQFLYDNADKFELSESERIELEDLLSHDFSSEGFQKERDEWLSVSLERERESKFVEMLSGGISLLGKVSPELEIICEVSSTVIDITNLKYKEDTKHQYNQEELHQLFIACAAYVGATEEFCHSVEITNKAIKSEIAKYGDDDFGKRMKEVGEHYLMCCEILADNSGEAYIKYAQQLAFDEEFDFFEGGSSSWAAAKLTDKVIEVKIKDVPWEGVLQDAGILKDLINTGVSVWEYFDDIDERSLERDKFLNAVLFYDAFSNALYDYQNGFFGELLNNPNKSSYQTLVTGIEMYLVAEEMIIDYAVNYSRLLKPALKDWKNSVFTLVDVSLYVKEVYRARYPDRSTSGRSVISCWKELNADMSDDDAQLLRFKHVFINNGDFTGLRHLYYITDEEAQELGGESYEKYQKLKEKVEIYSIFCPVNLAIKHGDEIIAMVENDTITLDSNEIFLNIYKEVDDEYAYKYVILPEGYTLEITGFDTGTMSFEKATIENGNVTTISTITDIPVQSGSSYTEVIEDNVTIALECDLDSNGVTDEILTAEVTESVFAQGDIDENEQVDITDATFVLTMYARTAADLPIDEYTETQRKSADVDSDSLITISDATNILIYYAQNAAGLNPTWDKILA